jgi:hypothetical protein
MGDSNMKNRKIILNLVRYNESVQVVVGRNIRHTDSSVSITTCYRLEVLGIESLWGRDFPDQPWGPPSLLYNGYRVSFLGVKWPGRGIDHPPPSRAEVKERVELYLYSPSGLLWPVIG